MPVKLVSITFENAPRIPGVRAGDMTVVLCDTPATPLFGWRALLRGTSLFFVSPRGWLPGRHSHEWDETAPSVIHEVPRVHVFLQWSGDLADVDTILAKGKFETPPFGPPPAARPIIEPGKGILAQLDPAQMGDP